ncbi:Lipopolysaccharide-modifying protein [Penicillium hispanicum]|uniref:Lipopolysaccharide-modifying protein n=1 Tax=Penicillium hispanicum TaxID=1080232 RepID=UPI0025405E58|nr:Lipopolysaccharide-modifying protein [Penicillium hispanicum]KAJ5584434.1 Lipopolysaccharide-modifying protein [Penicillium hispanicum]
MDRLLRYSEAFLATTKRRTITILTSIFLLAAFFWYRQPVVVVRNVEVPTRKLDHGGLFNGTWDYQRDKDNLLLDQDQCAQAFPGLFDEIDRPKRDRQSRPISLKEIDSITPRNGYIRAMIYDQQLYVIATEGHIYSREIATLHSLHRAIISSPETLPNIEFAFNSDDRIESVALWGYARQEKDKNIWLIPDFGYWSWPETKAGSMKEVVMKAEWAEEEEDLSWSKKVEKVLWRGATMGLKLREKLIAVASNQPWADVKALNWRDPDSMTNDLKSMSEHCEYKYLAHTEGNSYSGRLKYLQSCRSVIVTHEMSWIQHQHPLMRSSGPDQNFVTVKRDFSDLPDKILWLQTHDEDARRIADNNVKMFREHYLTQAAEVCYWRRLIHSWAEVSSFEPEFFKTENGKKVWRGLPVESFLLERRLEWDPY